MNKYNWEIILTWAGMVTFGVGVWWSIFNFIFL